jgi:preprotein translocase subunit YajC
MEALFVSFFSLTIALFFFSLFFFFFAPSKQNKKEKKRGVGGAITRFPQ